MNSFVTSSNLVGLSIGNTRLCWAVDKNRYAFAILKQTKIMHGAYIKRAGKVIELCWHHGRLQLKYYTRAQTLKKINSNGQ